MSNFTITSLSTWHKWLGHINFPVFKFFLHRLKIEFNDDSNGYICDSYQWTKTTKIYNRQPQKQVQWSYQFIHTDLENLIKPIGFLEEQYFFIFTNDCTTLIETYTNTKKSDWLKCLKTLSQPLQNTIKRRTFH